MKHEILNWLDGKLNYANYITERDTFESYNKRFANLLFNTRLSVADLHATDCYIITNNYDKVIFKLEKPKARSKAFKEFNVKRNEYIYDKIKLKEIATNFTNNDNVRNRAIILEFLAELKHANKSNNTFISNSDEYSYKNIFFDIKPNEVLDFIKYVKDSFVNNEADLASFNKYVDKIKKLNRDLREIGIFYPFKLDNDILSKKYYPYEINHIRFQKNNESFINRVHEYYEENGVNSDTSKPIFTLKKYFTYAGFTFHSSVAYFNPIVNLTKYEDEYIELKKHIEAKNLDFSNFIYELFDILNKAQFGVVKFQQENIINEIVTHNKGRQFSIKKISKLQLEKLQNHELGLSGIVYQEYAAIMHAFIHQDSSFRFTKNTTIDDMKGTDLWLPDVKERAQMYLDSCFMIKNKHKDSTLEFIYNQYKNDILQIHKKYKINKKEKEILLVMLMDLIYFYKVKDEKLSNSYNKTMEKIYKNYRYQDIENLINFNFQVEFIQKYKDEFDKYKPTQILGMDGSKKYMMIH